MAGPHRAILRSPIPVRGEELKTIAEFEVAAGDRVPFVLAYSESHMRPPAAINAEKALAATETFWCDWCKLARPVKKYGEAVTRSLITLKALTYAPTGGIVAAPTTSLPEKIGGTRNWDYR